MAMLEERLSRMSLIINFKVLMLIGVLVPSIIPNSPLWVQIITFVCMLYSFHCVCLILKLLPSYSSSLSFFLNVISFSVL